MFDIFNFKKKQNTSASFHEQTEAESVLVETLTTENTEVPVPSINLFDSSTPDLDLGDLNTGPKQPILKVSEISTQWY